MSNNEIMAELSVTYDLLSQIRLNGEDLMTMAAAKSRLSQLYKNIKDGDENGRQSD